ncbi:MAG: DUF3047 domain-containing protein [Anaerolineales bacterium]
MSNASGAGAAMLQWGVIVPLVSLLVLPQGVGPRDLLRLGCGSVGVGIPPGWRIRPVHGQVAPEAEIRGDEEDLALRLTGAGRAAWFYREVKIRSSEAGGILHWSWRVHEAPSGADLRRRETDDSPMRVYVVFGKPGSLFGGSGGIIFYSFGNQDPVAYSAPSHMDDRLHLVRVDGAMDHGRWRQHAVDPFADYRRIWGRTPPAITAIGVMQDTDQTKALAVAEIRQLEWIPGPSAADRAAEPS